MMQSLDIQQYVLDREAKSMPVNTLCTRLSQTDAGAFFDIEIMCRKCIHGDDASRLEVAAGSWQLDYASWRAGRKPAGRCRP